MDDVDRLDALARMLDRALTRAFESALADRSTTSAEFVMLSVLAAADGPLAWEAVEARLPVGYTPARATDAWNGLEAGGWAAEVDGRHVATDEGLEALEALHGEIERLHDHARDGISDEDYAVAVRVLRTMRDNVED
ncbi:MarR family winged helix-turn-helix transcriptional regulator [Demequina sp. NBRC 110053]|uniref:MarR family winged helix-turn-helix transcriptional regulator n=1 Tax=Demequina sp. NBRC 110053 TaxID=1570342 RepID=UPI001186020D|nr:hypothetical protein [Demequina sp. NBRC 110053]